MMEKSSCVVLSDAEKELIRSNDKLTKTAGDTPAVPERFEGWYTPAELKEIVDNES